jgi:hypothetical protein
MPAFEASASWSFTSTGTGKAVRAGMAQSLTFTPETSSGCTATVQILTRNGSSGGPYSVLSTLNCTLGEAITVQFLGPLKWVKPRVTDKTANSTNVVFVRLTGV